VDFHIEFAASPEKMGFCPLHSLPFTISCLPAVKLPAAMLPDAMLTQHTIQIRVRYDECDPMGFLHHSRYLQYFEIGRTELLRASGGNYRSMELSGQMVVVVRVECDYRKPLRYDDLVDLTTQVSQVTAGKIVHQYTLERLNPPRGDSELIAQAKVVLAVVDREGRLQRVPAELLAAYQRGPENED